MKKLFLVIRAYSLIPLLAVLGVHLLVYYGSKAINASFVMYDFTTAFDRMIPVISPFILIYLASFLYWVAGFIMAGYANKDRFYIFVVSSIICYLICFVFYLALPTTIGRPNLDNTNAFNWMILVLYDMDTPTNLLPSIHCMISWQCYKVVWGQKEIKKSYQVFSFIFAILVCISTQVIKQHYIVDLIVGIAISELFFYLVKRFNWHKYPQIFFEKINQKFNFT